MPAKIEGRLNYTQLRDWRGEIVCNKCKSSHITGEDLVIRNNTIMTQCKLCRKWYLVTVINDSKRILRQLVQAHMDKTAPKEHKTQTERELSLILGENYKQDPNIMSKLILP